MAYSALKNAVLSEKIDWVAYSQANSFEWDLPPYIDNHWKKIYPLKNYTNGEENKQGVRRYWNTEIMSQGKHVVMSGTASGILQENLSPFLQWLISTGRKPTRVDYSVDVTHSKLKAETANTHVKKREIITHAQSARVVTDEFKGGFTQYLGTKSSETYTRIYDKSKEQNTDYGWVRFETVYQGDRAAPSVQAYLQCASTRPLIKSHVDFPRWEDFGRIMSGDIVKLVVSPKPTNTRHWLLTQVAKSMASELSRDEEHGLWFEFIQAIQVELVELGREREYTDW